jgi:hypothetical protein
MAIVVITFIIGFVAGCTASASLFLWQRKPASQGQKAVDVAMRAILALDDLVRSCHAAALDYPDFDEEDPGQYYLHTDDPQLVLPRELAWTLLGEKFANELAWLPNRLGNIIDGLAAIDIDPPDFNGYFEHRQYEFAQLGLAAADLLDRLCEAFRLPQPERPSFYDPLGELKQQTIELASYFRRSRESSTNVPADASNVTSIFASGKFDPER